jgi:hypothetical protein
MSAEPLIDVPLTPFQTLEVVLGLGMRIAAHERELADATPGTNFHEFCAGRLAVAVETMDWVYMHMHVGFGLARLVEKTDRAEAEAA